MPSRRTFLKASASLALIPVVNLPWLQVRAAERMPLDDPAGVALKYVEDASEADRIDKMGVAGKDQFCDNCQFYTADAADSNLGGCALFQNRLVPAKGWCSGWVPKS